MKRFFKSPQLDKCFKSTSPSPKKELLTYGRCVYLGVFKKSKVVKVLLEECYEVYQCFKVYSIFLPTGWCNFEAH